MPEWSNKRIETICADINRSLAILTKGYEPADLPVEVESHHFSATHKQSALMRKMGLVETVRRGGKSQDRAVRRMTRIKPTTYRVHRASITVEELIEFLNQSES